MRRVSLSIGARYSSAAGSGCSDGLHRRLSAVMVSPTVTSMRIYAAALSGGWQVQVVVQAQVLDRHMLVPGEENIKAELIAYTAALIFIRRV